MDDMARRLRAAIARSPLVTTDAGGLHSCSGGTHTRLADGRQLCWVPGRLFAGAAYAIDAEVAASPVPKMIAQSARRRGLAAPAAHVPQDAGRGLSDQDEKAHLWWLWTRAEARAKLRDVPILAWIGAVDWAADADAPPATLRGLGVGVTRRAIEPEAAVHVVTERRDDLVVSFGAAWPHRARTDLQ